jgi:Fe-coproporphyrin III synthase
VSALVDSVTLEVQQHLHRIHILPVVILYLNNICDSRCVTCSIWKNNDSLRIPAERQMPDELLEELYRTIPSWRPKQILLSGGEPALHPRFSNIVPEFKRITGKVCVITNGLLLNSLDPAVLETVDEFYISFDAPDAETYERIRGVDGFDRLAASVKLLRSLRIPPKIVARCTLQRENVRCLPELVRVADEFGFHSLSFLAADVSSQAFSRDAHGAADSVAIQPGIEDLKIMEASIESAGGFDDGFVEGGAGKLKRLLQYFRALIGEGELPPVRCNAPWISVVIETTGKIRGCFFQRVIGDFRNINGRSATSFRRALNVATDPTCRRCVCSKFLTTSEFIRM